MRIRRLALWGVLLATPIGLAVSCSLVEANAEARARAFCNRFPIGSSVAEVAKAARDAGDSRHRMIRASDISIAYIGVPPFSRHVCSIEGESGKVTKARYVHID